MRWRMLSCETLLVAAGACSDESDDSSVVLLVQINTTGTESETSARLLSLQCMRELLLFGGCVLRRSSRSLLC